MATLKEAIYEILETDAKDGSAGALGSLIGMTGSAPYGVYFRNPPEGVDFGTYSILTYYISSMSGRAPAGLREVYVNLTAWGDNYEQILERVYELLHEAQLTGVTDYAPLLLVWDYGGPELFDEDLRIYYQQHRYLAKAVKL